MEAFTLAVLGASAAIFAGAGVYLHFLRQRSERAAPELLITPHAAVRHHKKKR